MSAQVASVPSVFSQKMEPNDQVSVAPTSCTQSLLNKNLCNEGKVTLTQQLPLPRLAGEAVRFLADIFCMSQPFYSPLK